VPKHAVDLVLYLIGVLPRPGGKHTVSDRPLEDSLPSIVRRDVGGLHPCAGPRRVGPTVIELNLSCARHSRATCHADSWSEQVGRSRYWWTRLTRRRTLRCRRNHTLPTAG